MAPARYGSRDLADRPFNAVRFLYRLASLYLTAKIHQTRGQRFYISGIEGGPTVRGVSGPGDLSLLLSEAV